MSVMCRPKSSGLPLANASLRSDASDADGIGVRFRPSRHDANTVHIDVMADSRRADATDVDVKIKHLKELLTLAAGQRDWGWLRVSSGRDDATVASRVSEGTSRVMENATRVTLPARSGDIPRGRSFFELDNDDSPSSHPVVTPENAEPGPTEPTAVNRLEYLANTANSALAKNAWDADGYVVSIIAGVAESRTIHIVVSYDESRVNKKSLDNYIALVRGTIANLAKKNGWEDALQVVIAKEPILPAAEDEAN